MKRVEKNNKFKFSFILLSLLLIFLFSLYIFSDSLEVIKSPSGFSVFSDIFNKITGQNSPNLGPNDISAQAGNTWFVKNGGSNVLSGNNWNNAWSSIQWASVTAGDTICFAGGNYNYLTISSSGNIGSKTLIKRAVSNDSSCGSVVLGWNSIYDSKVNLTGIGLTNINNFIIDGIVEDGIYISFTACNSAIQLSNSQNIEFRNLELVGPGVGYSYTCSGESPGIYVPAVTSPATNTITNVLVRNVDIHDTNAGFWLFDSNNLTVEYSEIYDIGSGNEGPVGPTHSNMMYIDKSSNLTFRYNRIHNYASTGLYCAWDGNQYLGFKIYGNVFYNTQAPLIGRAVQAEIYNNAFYNAGAPDGNFVNLNSALAGSTLYNNIFWGGGSLSWNGNVVHTNNMYKGSYWGYPVVETAGVFNATISPFVDAAVGNFNILSTVSTTSPRDKGRLINAVSGQTFNLDGNRNIRGSDGLWDIGAYEYVSTSSSSICEAVSGGKCWYVDKDASCVVGSTCNGSSWSNAWKSFSAINWANINPGDVIYISGGSSSKTYTEIFNVGKSGSLSASIKIRPGQDIGHNGIVIFDYSSQSSANAATINAMDISRSYITLDGNYNGENHIIIQNLYNIYDRYSGTGIYGFGTSTSVRLAGVIIDHITFKNVNNGVRLAYLDNFIVRNCNFSGVRGDVAIELFSLNPAATWDNSQAYNNYVELWYNNAVPSGSSASIYFGPDGIQIHNGASIYNNTIKVVATSLYTSDQHPDSIQNDGRYVKIFNNQFINVGDSAIDLGTSSDNDVIQDIWIYNNLFKIEQQVEGLTEFIRLYASAGYGGSVAAINNIKILNNIFLDNNEQSSCDSATAGWSYCPIDFIDYVLSPTAIGNEIRNNIFINTGSGANGPVINIKPSSGFTSSSFSFSNNVYYSSSGSAYIKYNGVNYAASSWVINQEGGTGKTNLPSFVSYTYRNVNNNLHLLSSDNIARNSGISLSSYFTTDKDGVIRPQEGIWDIGAYEYSSGSQTAVNGQCGLTLDSCNAGTYLNTTDNSSSYLWNCLGQNGGSNSSCSYIKPTILNVMDGTNISITQFGSYLFNITSAGNYILVGNVNAPDDSSNSFYVSIDVDPGTSDTTGLEYIWDINPFTSGYQDRNVSSRGQNGNFTWSEFNPKNWSLSVGIHTLYLNQRPGETGTQISLIKFVKLSSSNLYHPADLNTDLAISLNEFTNYSSYFKLAKAWPFAPSPPDANYYSRAYFLLKRGITVQGAYSYNSSSSCPSCFIVR